MKKAIFITNIPTYYKVALLNHVTSELLKRDVFLKIYFVSSSRRGRSNWSHTIDAANFSWEYLKKIRLARFDIITNFLQVFEEEKPEVVIISGNVNFYAMQISLISRFKQIPQILYSGVAGDDRGLIKVSFLPRILRLQFRKLLFNRADAIIAHGQTHTNYARRIIKNRKKPIFLSYNTTDITKFFKKENLINEKILRVFKDTNSNCNLLYCGDLIERKGLDLLLKSISLIKDQNFVLHIVGNGDQKPYLTKLSFKFRIENKIKFWDSVPPADIPSFYCSAEIFILPTRYDIWGLVINEAMAASLPVISSKYAVAATEIIDHGVNGYIVDPEDIQRFSDQIKTLILDRKLREQIGENAYNFAKDNLLISKSGEDVARAIYHVLTDSEN